MHLRVRVVGMVGWDHQTAFVWAVSQLDAGAWPCGIPAPARLASGFGNLFDWGPTHAIIIAVSDVDTSDFLARATYDLAFMVGTQVPRQRQPYSTGRAVDYGTWIADRIGLVVRHHQ